LGESSGTNADDVSTVNNNDGTYVASPTLGVTGAVGDTDTAVTFNGSTQYVTIPDANSLDLGNTFSLECWVKRGAAGAQGLIAKGGSYRLDINANVPRLRNAATATIVSSSVAIVDTTTWHHIVATKNGATAAKFYLDGVDVSTGYADSTIADSASALILAANSAVANFLTGTLDEVAVYNVVLTPTQVLNHYTIGTARLNGTSAGAGSTTGTVTATWALAGSSAGAGSTAAETSVTWALVGSSTAAGTTSAETSVTRPLAGASAGAGTTAGDVTVAWTLNGDSAGVGSTAGDVSVAYALVGSSTGAGATQGDVSVTWDLAGESTGAGDATGGLGIILDLHGDSAGQGSTDGDLTNTKVLEGSTAGAGSTVGAVFVTYALEGISSGVGDVPDAILTAGDEWPPSSDIHWSHFSDNEWPQHTDTVWIGG
jgi:hypothetical protein